MSRCVIYVKRQYMIVQNGHGKSLYYTIINTELNTHVHINAGIKVAKIIVQRACSGDTTKLNMYKKSRVEILRGENESWNSTHATKIHKERIDKHANN